jgi:hypothetical protein
MAVPLFTGSRLWRWVFMLFWVLKALSRLIN